MILDIPVNEAIEIIKAKAHKPISLRTVNESTINAGYEVNVKVPLLGPISKTISIDIIIDKVVDTDIFFHCSTGIAAGDSVIKALLSYFMTSNDSKVIDVHDNGHITAHLKEIKQLEGVLEKIRLNSLSFGQDSIFADFIPKI